MRKKSNYKPKGVRLDNLNWVLSGMRRVGALPGVGVSSKLQNHEALDSILKGQGTREHVEILMAALNMSEALIRIRDDLGADWKDEMDAAQDAVHMIGRRGREKNIFAFTGPEMTAVKMALEIHDAQLDNCSVKEMEQALFIVEEEIRMKKARAIVRKA